LLLLQNSKKLILYQAFYVIFSAGSAGPGFMTGTVLVILERSKKLNLHQAFVYVIFSAVSVAVLLKA
jgi:hypothetical protein